VRNGPGYRRSPAGKRIGEPRRQTGDIIKCQHVAIIGCDESSRSSRGSALTGAASGSTSARSILEIVVFADPGSSDIANSG
jgi:hypothetical protein